MKLDKLTNQLEDRQQGLAAVFGATPAPAPAPAEAPPASASKRQPVPTSKRSTWKACTFYLPPETKARLERVLLQRKLAGTAGAADQSEAIDEALQAWLAKAERPFA
jgi:hypothetical protein